MQLRRIKDAYDYKQKVEDKGERSVRHKAMMAVIREIRDNHLVDIRAEVAGVTDDTERCGHFLYLDDLISFKIILIIIDELRYAHQEITFAKLKGLTQDESDQFKYSTEMIQSVKEFETYLTEYAVAEINADGVRRDIQSLCHTSNSRLAWSCNFSADDIDQAFKDAVETDLVLACLQKFFEQSDSRQTSKWSQAAAFLGLTREGVLKPYVSMPALMGCVCPTPETKKLWEELNIWLRGIHYYHASLLKRALDLKRIQYSTDNEMFTMPENKPYPPINVLDEAMKARFGLTFYDLAIHVHKASQVLALKLSSAAPAAEAGRVSQVGLYAVAAASTDLLKDDESIANNVAFTP